MAFDEWLLARAGHSPGSVYLRLYTWQEPTITFGYGQRKEAALDFTQLSNTPAIRRITGGRALLHDLSELTYAIVANTEAEPGSRLGRSVPQTSRLIAGLMREFLYRLGIESDYVRQSPREERSSAFFHKAPCFKSVSRHELTSQGKKMVASAQKRLECTFLQHGSIKWRGLAHHPALDLPGESIIAPLQPVVEKELAQTAALFGKIFASELDISVRKIGLTEQQESWLAHRSAELEKKPLSRRGIVAQNQNPASL